MSVFTACPSVFCLANGVCDNQIKRYGKRTLYAFVLPFICRKPKYCVTVYAMKRRVSQHKLVNYRSTKGTFQRVAFQQSSASVCTKPCVAFSTV